MGKDPAFLFYPGDWLGGTMGMSLEQKGAYLELLIYQFNNHQFTEEQARTVIGGLWDGIKHKFTKVNEGHFYNERLRIEKEKRQNYTESRRQSRLKCDEDNVRIYLLKDLDNGLIKIGSSVNPLRRYNEITNQTISISGSSDNRNYKLTWYSEQTIRKIENLLHDLFKDKRFDGEWFKLTNSDISELKSIVAKTYVNHKDTYVERTDARTSERTENENENENENKDKNKDLKFSRFWKIYPKKKSKGHANKVFSKINPDEQLLAIMIAKIEQAMKSEDWIKENGKYIPHPATWLNNRGWEDEDTQIHPLTGIVSDKTIRTVEMLDKWSPPT